MFAVKKPFFSVWIFPKRTFMRLPSTFNEETSKDLYGKDEQQISIKEDEKNFQVSLDTSAFRPDEIKISVDSNNLLSIEANHEEKSEDGHKLVERRFIRKYTLPTNCKPENVVSNLSSDGVLMVTAPKLAIEDKRNVPIQQ